MNSVSNAALSHTDSSDLSTITLTVRQVRALVTYTVRESLHRWTLITYLAGITFFLVLMATAVNLDIVEGTLASARLFGQDVQIGDMQIQVADVVRTGNLSADGSYSASRFVELPTAGDAFEKMEVFGTIEAVKAVSDLYCPISGEIIAVNESLEDDPALVNSDPYGEGWMIRVRPSDMSEFDDLLTAEAYAALVESQ